MFGAPVSGVAVDLLVSDVIHPFLSNLHIGLEFYMALGTVGVIR